MSRAGWIGLRHRHAASPDRAPRFVVRVVATAFATVVGVQGAVSAVLVLETRAVVERGVATIHHVDIFADRRPDDGAAEDGSRVRLRRRV